MTRRCSVMRMPLATHWASILAGFPTITSSSAPRPHHRILGRAGPCEPQPGNLLKVAPQHQRSGRGAGGVLVIARAAADLVEAGMVVQFQRRAVAVLDLEKHGADRQA